MKRLLLIIIIALIILGSGYAVLKAYTTSPIDRIGFTQEMWDPFFLSSLDRTPKYIPKTQKFDIPNPPLSSSQTTKDELDFLREISLQQAENKELILFEADPDVSAMGMMYKGNIIPEKYWENDSLVTIITEAIFETSPYFIIREKKHFSRPRPSQIAPDLTLAIKNPGHAAYPSGHATEAHMVAYLLGPLFPEHYDALLDYAYSIAHRREIAGVHYPSDSEAGKILARQIIDALLQNEDYAKLYTKAWEDVQKTRHQ